MTTHDTETNLRIMLAFALSLAFLIWMAREACRMPPTAPMQIERQPEL